MERPPLRDLAIPIVVLGVLASVFFLHYGTKFGWDQGVLWVFTVVSIVSGIAIVLLTAGPRCEAVALVVLGIVVFYLGAGGGTCTDLGAPDDDEPHEITYHPSTNVLEFGAPIPGAGYRCHTIPVWPVMLLGSAMTSAGFIGAFGRDA